MPIIISTSYAVRAAWHRMLIASNVGAQFEEGNLVAIPNEQLQLIRDYLARKRTRFNHEDPDELLCELIEEHVAHNGSREVATLACLSEFGGLSAITALHKCRHNVSGRSAYLLLLLAAHKIQPVYVSQEVAQVATALLRIRKGEPEPLLIFREMIHVLKTMRDSTMLPVLYINDLLKFCRIKESYQMCIAGMRNRNKFCSLYRTMAWVKDIMVNRERYGLAYAVISDQVPELQLWAIWQPDEAMLQRWEEYAFTPEHTTKLRPIFDLEGPDTTGAGYRTFKEAGPAHFRALKLRPPDLDVKSLHALLLRAMDNGNEAINVMCKLCLGTQITPLSIQLASDIIDLRDDGCYRASCRIFEELKTTATPVAQLLTLTSVLPLFQQHPGMITLLAHRVGGFIVPVMQSVQNNYRKNVKRNGKDGLGSMILSYGRAISKATWLSDFVVWPEIMFANVSRMPSDEVFQSVMQQLDRPHSDRVDALLKEYLAATIGGAGSADDIASLQQALDAEREFVLSHPEVERNRILAAIKELDYVTDIDFLRDCRKQILSEDLVLIKDLLPLIESGIHKPSCTRMLRNLARRIELPMDVSKVWLSLALLMMSSHKTSLLDWACDSLTVQQWFQFVADIMVVFPEQHEQVGSLGMTAERFLWWKQLQSDVDYYRCVEKLDRQLRRMNGGIVSMKWLYLKEVPDVDKLLDAIAGRMKLGYDWQDLLGLCRPAKESLATLCNFIAAHSRCSPRALLGIRLVLERHRTDGAFPDSVLAVYMLAWTQSKLLTNEEKKAFSLLSELIGITPAMNPQGTGLIVSNMRKAYDSMMELARQAETIRFQLSRKDEDRTTAYARALGMQGMSSYFTPDIPPNLYDSIKCTGLQQYELCFPLTHLKDHDRKVCGLGSDPSSILTVHVTLQGDKDNHGFCIHLSSCETVQDRRLSGSLATPSTTAHGYWLPYASERKLGDCAFKASVNLFTYALLYRLHRHFANPEGGVSRVTPKSIHETVNSTIAWPGSECITCGKQLGRVWKPTVCSRPKCDAALSRVTFPSKTYNLLVDGSVLDFLLGCVYAAACDDAQQMLFLDLPFDKTKLRDVLNSFPAMTDSDMNPRALLNKIRSATPKYFRERESLLDWISDRFQGCMLSAPPDKQVPAMADVKQFLLYDSGVDIKDMSTAAREAVNETSSTSAASNTGKAMFYGSLPAYMFEALTGGSLNKESLSYRSPYFNGRPYVYLDRQLAASHLKSDEFIKTWAKSAFANKKVVLGCELLETPRPRGTEKPPAHIQIPTAELQVLVRYVLICPPTYLMPATETIESAMQTTFRALRAGPGTWAV